MTREKILNEFTAKIKDFQKMALNIAGVDDADDLFQTVSLMLLEFDEDRLISYYNPKQGLKPIFLRICCNQYKSGTSKFHKDYRREKRLIKEKGVDITLNAPQSFEEYEEKYFSKIDETCNAIYNDAGNTVLADLEKTVWELYVEKASLRKALAAMPEKYAGVLDLKTVHIIVNKFKRTLPFEFLQ